MKSARPAARLALLVLAALACSNPAVAQRSTAVRPALAPAEGEVIVKFKPGADTLRKRALSVQAAPATVQQVLGERAGALGARVGRALEPGAAVGERSQVVRAAGVDAAVLAAQLAADPEVEYAVPNGRKRVTVAPNDPLYPAAAPGVRANGPDSGQWYLRKPDASIPSAIDIEAAWAFTTGDSGTVVAVLDTGVRFEHPDLGRAATGGKLLPGYDFVTNVTTANDGNARDADPSDPGDWCGTGSSSWHGTSTASLVGAAANSTTPTGMAGAAPGVLVLPVRVLGKCGGVDSDIQAAMRWAAGIPVPGVPDNPNPAKVINLSLGGSGACSAAYRDVVNEVLARGTLIVAAAGNSNGGAVSEPANCPGVIGVAGLRHAGSKVGFSDLGAEIGIAAPAGNCINTDGGPCLYPILAATNLGTQGPGASAWTHSFDISVGTSFASPLVAAVAGLMYSQQPALTPATVAALLKAASRPFPGTGADNGADDPTPVPSCHQVELAGPSGQCYCPNDGQLCGAGMLDAGRSLAGAAGQPLAHIVVATTTPTAGSAVLLSGAISRVGAGATPSYSWSVVDNGGIVVALSSNNQASTSLTPSAAGRFTVQLRVSDASGASDVTTQTVSVAAAPTPAPTPASTSGGGGGGGSTAPAWVLGLLLATLALRRPAASPR